MSEMGELFNGLKMIRQEKRAANRKSSPDILKSAGIDFESKNDGSHLIVNANGKTFDFWPGTGLWMERGKPNRNRGVRKLIKAAGK